MEDEKCRYLKLMCEVSCEVKCELSIKPSLKHGGPLYRLLKTDSNFACTSNKK